MTNNPLPITILTIIAGISIFFNTIVYLELQQQKHIYLQNFDNIAGHIFMLEIAFNGCANRLGRWRPILDTLEQVRLDNDCKR